MPSPEPPAEAKFIESHLSAVHVVFEWGTGGTLTLPKRVARYFSLEHEAEWFESLLPHTDPEKEKSFLYLVAVADEDGTGSENRFRNYIDFPAVLGLKFDRILINGRCRVACAKEVARSGLLAEGGLVFVHGWNRERYHEILNWYEVVDEIRTDEHDSGGIAALKLKQPNTLLEQDEPAEPSESIRWVSNSDEWGLGDRLRGIASGAVFAELLNKRLLVKWTECQECPGKFSDIFIESPYFSTYTEDDDPILAQHNITQEWDFRINMMPDEFSKVVRQIPDFYQDVPEVEEHGGELPYDELVWRWAVILRCLTPVPSIAAHLEKLSADLVRERTLGVHLRRSDVMDWDDKPINRENAHLFDNALWQRILSEIETGDYTHIYLASDDKRYFFEWRERLSALPVVVVSFEQSWGTGLRQTPLEGVVVDILMLSKCKLILGSVFSSLLFVANALGTPHELISPPAGL